jgi:hypothetical protein
MATPQIEVRGLKEALAAMRKVDKQIPKTVRRIHKEVGEVVASRARSAADRRTASAIKSRSTQRNAKIIVGLRPPVAIGRVVGANRRFGWYSHPRYRGSSGRQYRPHLGSSWTPEQLYQVGPAMPPAMDEALKLLEERFTDLFREAFPD